MSIQDGLQQVKELIQQGELDEAFSACQKLLSQASSCGVIHTLIGSIYEQQQEYGLAMEAYREAIATQPDYAEAYVYLAQLYRDVGWINEAASYYYQALKIRWYWPEVHDYFASVLYLQGKTNAAIQHHREAIKQNPSLVQPYLNLALRLYQKGQVKSVIQLLEATIERFPDCAKAYYNLGCLYLQENQTESAIQLLQVSLKLDPNFALAYHQLGHAWIKIDHFKNAIAAYQQALEINPELTNIYRYLGKVWQQQNQHNQAVYYFELALKNHPDNLLIYGDCGYSLIEQGKLYEAMICFQTAITIEPKWVKAFCDRFAAFSIKDHQQDQLLCAQITCASFLQSLQQFDLTKPDHQIYKQLANIHYYCGNTLAEYGQNEAATIYYQTAIKILPFEISFYLKLAQSYLHLKRWDAIFAIGYFVQNLPHLSQADQISINLLLGYCCEQKKRYSSAIQYYHQALKNQQNSDKQKQNERLLLINIASQSNNTEKIKPDKIRWSTLEWLKEKQLEKQSYFCLKDVSSTPQYAQPQSPACAGLECNTCVNQIFQNLELINLGNNIQTSSIKKPLTNESFSQFVAIIPQGKAWITPQINYWNVCKAIAIITPDNQLLADVSRDYPGQLPGCTSYHPSQHQIFQQTQLPPLQKIEASVAVLSGLSGDIYFHWMVDILPRIALLKRSGIDFNKIDYFLVNSIRLPFQKQTLEKLGIPLHKVIESDHFPHLQATQLIVPSFAGYLGWLEPWAIEFLRQQFLPQGNKVKSDYPQRIYISRNNARHRRVLNETEVMAKLSQYGFVSIQLESLTFTEQVALFSQAKAIITPHGSGLTNIVFCNSSAKVAEFVSPHYNRHYYWVISQYLGLEHYCLTGEAFACYPIRMLMYQNPLTEDIWVNLTDLQKLLEIMEL